MEGDDSDGYVTGSNGSGQWDDSQFPEISWLSFRQVKVGKVNYEIISLFSFIEEPQFIRPPNDIIRNDTFDH